MLELGCENATVGINGLKSLGLLNIDDKPTSVVYVSTNIWEMLLTMYLFSKVICTIHLYNTQMSERTIFKIPKIPFSNQTDSVWFEGFNTLWHQT